MSVYAVKQICDRYSAILKGERQIFIHPYAFRISNLTFTPVGAIDNGH